MPEDGAIHSPVVLKEQTSEEVSNHTQKEAPGVTSRSTATQPVLKSYAAAARSTSANPVFVEKPKPDQTKENLPNGDRSNGDSLNGDLRESRSRQAFRKPLPPRKSNLRQPQNSVSASETRINGKSHENCNGPVKEEVDQPQPVQKPVEKQGSVPQQLPPVKSFATVAKNGIAAMGKGSTEAVVGKGNVEKEKEVRKMPAQNNRVPESRATVTTQSDKIKPAPSELTTSPQKSVPVELRETMSEPVSEKPADRHVVSAEKEKSAAESSPTDQSLESNDIPSKDPSVAEELVVPSPSSSPQPSSPASGARTASSTPFTIDAPEFIPSSFRKDSMDGKGVAGEKVTPNLDSSGISSASSLASNGFHEQSSKVHNNDSKFSTAYKSTKFSPHGETFTPHYPPPPVPSPFPHGPKGMPASFYPAQVTTKMTRNGPLLVNSALAYAQPYLESGVGGFYAPTLPTTVIKSFYFPTIDSDLVIGHNGLNLRDLMRKEKVELWIDEDDLLTRRQGYSMIHIHGPERNVESCVSNIRNALSVRASQLQAVATIRSQGILYPPISNLDIPCSIVTAAFVASVEENGVMFIQLPAHPSVHKLNFLEDDLNRYGKDPDTPFIDHRMCPIEKDCIVAAPVHVEGGSDKWMRAKVLSRGEDDLLQMRAIDHGWLFTTSITSLKPLTPEFCVLPAQAIECRVLLGRYDASHPLEEQINRNLEPVIENKFVKIRAVAKQFGLYPVVETWIPITDQESG